MINIEKNKWVPSPEYKYISNGEIWTDSIYLGRSDNINNWHDTNDEPPSQEEIISPDNNEYKTALQILLGVKDGDL